MGLLLEFLVVGGVDVCEEFLVALLLVFEGFAVGSLHVSQKLLKRVPLLSQLF